MQGGHMCCSASAAFRNFNFRQRGGWFCSATHSYHRPKVMGLMIMDWNLQVKSNLFSL